MGDGERGSDLDGGDEVPASEEGMDAGDVSAGGDATLEEGDGRGSGKSTKPPRIQGLYKPPTHAELQSLKETQDLFKSNLMKLQVSPSSPALLTVGEIPPIPVSCRGRAP